MVNKKPMSIEDLAVITNGLGASIDSLAIVTQQGFMDITKTIDDLSERMRAKEAEEITTPRASCQIARYVLESSEHQNSGVGKEKLNVPHNTGPRRNYRRIAGGEPN